VDPDPHPDLVPYQIKREDLDPHQSDKLDTDPDPHQFEDDNPTGNMYGICAYFNTFSRL
jgi:hypothetical protein